VNPAGFLSFFHQISRFSISHTLNAPVGQTKMSAMKAEFQKATGGDRVLAVNSGISALICALNR